MILKINKPKTPSQRHVIKITRENLEKTPKLKSKIVGLKRQAGRSHLGKITVRHKGGGHKKRYRFVDFERHNDAEGIVCSLEYDPNRNANIAAIFDTQNNTFFYIIAPFDLSIGDIVKSGNSLEPKVGYAMPLRDIPVGSYIHNVSLKKKTRAKLTRAAGTYAILIEKTFATAQIQLSSGKVKQISADCSATVGLVSNEAAFLTKKGKAGNSRWAGIRPTVRGVAMNPVDHPHGGGEGKKSGPGKTPWGKTTKKGKTKNG